MNDALSEAIKEAYASAPTNVVILETLEIDHEDLAEPIRLVRNRENLTFTLEDASSYEFEGAAFRMALPAAGDNGVQDLMLAIDNTDQRLTDFVNTVKASIAPVTCTYRPYRSDDLTTPQMDPPLVLYLHDINLNSFEVSARASFADIINRKFPSVLYTRSRFPSLGN